MFRYRGVPNYCQLLDRISRDISRDVWNFTRYLKMFMHLFHDFIYFSRNLYGGNTALNGGWRVSFRNSGKQSTSLNEK